MNIPKIITIIFMIGFLFLGVTHVAYGAQVQEGTTKIEGGVQFVGKDSEVVTEPSDSSSNKPSGNSEPSGNVPKGDGKQKPFLPAMGELAGNSWLVVLGIVFIFLIVRFLHKK